MRIANSSYKSDLMEIVDIFKKKVSYIAYIEAHFYTVLYIIATSAKTRRRAIEATKEHKYTHS